VTKKEIAKAIADDFEITTVLAGKIIQHVLEHIIETVESEGRIELRNFGVFEVRQRRARQARNPRTGEQVWVPEKMVVIFKPGREMEEKVRKAGTTPKKPGKLLSR
jgi:integration host factor subunit beta